LKFFARDDLTWMFEEHGEDKKRLDLQSDLASGSIQFSCAQTHFVSAEAHHICGLAGPRH
jgi:hypothetical protein